MKHSKLFSAGIFFVIGIEGIGLLLVIIGLGFISSRSYGLEHTLKIINISVGMVLILIIGPTVAALFESHDRMLKELECQRKEIEELKQKIGTKNN